MALNTKKKMGTDLKPSVLAALATALLAVAVVNYFIGTRIASRGIHIESDAPFAPRSPPPAVTTRAASVRRVASVEPSATSAVTPTSVDTAPRSGGSSAPRNKPLGRRRRRDRFPTFGTDDFTRRCGWATDFTQHRAKNPKLACTLLARPTPTSNEGVAAWAIQVVIGKMFAQQSGCRLLLDYGLGVDVRAVLSPVGDDGSHDFNWTVPEGFDCKREKRCALAYHYKENNLQHMAGKFGKVLSAVPEYRLAYNNKIDPDEYRDLTATALPGFRIFDGPACAINSVFALSPSAAQFVPALFKEILPAVRDEDALVLSLYLRTGNTDEMAKMEKEGKEMKERVTTKLALHLQRIVDCALQVEGERLSDPTEPPISRVVWMVITDSPSMGELVASTYDGREVVPANGTSAAVAGSRRKVLTTSARGVQTRPQRGPSTADFAEAIIDWYLLGESDAVVLAHAMSFGATGAMRTARRVFYAAKGCEPRTMIRRGNGTRVNMQNDAAETKPVTTEPGWG